MALKVEFLPLTIEEVAEFSAERKRNGWRFVQILAVNTENGVDVQYSFQKDDVMQNHTIAGVKADQVIPSITNEFFSAFVFENEVHDLFGVKIENIAIDFGGKFYCVAKDAPMTIISPAQLAAREKAAKLAAAQKAKEAKAAKEAQAGAEGQDAVPAAPAVDDMEAKLAGMDPEKAAKVRAAMEAKAKKEAAAKAAAEQAAKDEELEAKLAGMDPEKAAKVRAAMEAKAAKAKAAAEAQKEGE